MELNMKRKILMIISAILAFITVTSCFAGCEKAFEEDSTGDVTNLATNEQASDNKEEEPTEKATKKTTKKTTAKKETQPIPGKTQATTTLKARTYNLGNASDRNNFRTVGRVQYTDTGILFDHCANVIEFQGYMTGDLKLNANSSGSNKNHWTYLTVYIDGKRVEKRFVIEGNDKTITLATFDGNFFHTVRIVKQTEIANSDSRLKNVIMTGYLTKAPEERKHYIEFFGDSLTAGYSNIATKDYPSSEESNGIYQDATQTYAFIASEALNADCSILAKSGTGLARGYVENYNNNIWNFFSKASYPRGDEAFDFSGARVPDLVVIHLGANDYANDASKDRFVSKGKELVDNIKKGYGKVIPIIWAYVPGEQVPTSWMQEILNYYKSTYNGQTYMISLEWRSQGKINGHPNVKGHQKNANELVDFIVKNNLLK
jgi:lysophospholipase L1-like esterase